MRKILVLFFLISAAFVLGAWLAPHREGPVRSYQLDSSPSTLARSPDKWEVPAVANASLLAKADRRELPIRWRPGQHYFHFRSLLRQVVLGLHEPAVRSLAVRYLAQSWIEIKKSTASISPEAEAKLETGLEPFAQQPLHDLESILSEPDLGRDL